MKSAAPRIRLPRTSWPGTSMYLSGNGHARIELDFAEGLFVVHHVLLQDGEQRLGLLRAEINSLEVGNFHLGRGLLLQGAKDQEEVPYIHAHLHAIGIVFPVIFVVGELDIGLRGSSHISSQFSESRFTKFIIIHIAAECLLNSLQSIELNWLA